MRLSLKISRTTKDLQFSMPRQELVSMRTSIRSFLGTITNGDIPTESLISLSTSRKPLVSDRAFLLPSNINRFLHMSQQKIYVCLSFIFCSAGKQNKKNAKSQTI